MLGKWAIDVFYKIRYLIKQTAHSDSEFKVNGTKLTYCQTSSLQCSFTLLFQNLKQEQNEYQLEKIAIRVCPLVHFRLLLSLSDLFI